MELLPYLLLFVLFFHGNGVYAQTPCTGTSLVGNNANGNKDDGNTGGHGYFIAEDIACCGTITQWYATLKDSSEDLRLQVWRPSGGAYELIGENVYPQGSATPLSYAVPASSQINVQSGDRIGWWSANNIVRNNPSNSGSNTIVESMAASVTVGSVHTWGGSSAGLDYDLRADLRPGNAPVITSSAGTATTILNDNGVGTPITTITATDADPTDVVTMSMSASTKFQFNAVTGEVTVSSSLAGPTTTETLTFNATDLCNQAATQVVLVVTITNEPPVVYGSPAVINLSEDETAETLLYTINVTDTVDIPSCAMAASVPGSYPFQVKQISQGNYGIYTTVNPSFSYSTQNSYVLTYECTDYAPTVVPGTLNVYLIPNQPPVITNLQAATSISTTAAIGTTVFNVVSTDAENETLTYGMLCDPTPCPFEMFASGAILLKSSITNYTTVGYDIEITVNDSKNSVGPKLLTVIIKDINDPILISNLPLTSSYTVPENTATSTPVFMVSYSDQDSTQTRFWSMTSSGAGLTHFSIDPSTGVISTAGTTTNYEALSTAGSTAFTFTVTVSDGTASDTQPIVIDVTNVNEPPAFSQASYSISGNEGGAGTILGTPSFGITDPDNGDSYTLAMDCGSNTAYFYMDHTSGQVTFQSNYDIDAGLPASVTCTVTVTDSSGLTDTASLLILIADLNDNTPAFSPAAYAFHISYYAGVGTTVGTVTATDGDSGSYGTLTYSLDQSTLLAEHFSIDSSGVITVKETPQGNAIGYSTSVVINATATDGGALSDHAQVSITISDTTTSGTTTTTDRYRKFIEDSRNVAWLIPCCVLIATMFGYLAWLIYSCKGAKGFAAFKEKLCPKRLKRYQHGRQRWRPPPTPPVRLPPPPPPVPLHSIRNPPPPKRYQSWRTTLADVPNKPSPTHGQYEFWKDKDITENRLTGFK